MNRALTFIFVTVLIDAIGFGVVIPVFPQLIVRLSGQPLASAAEVWAGSPSCMPASSS